MNSPNLSPLLFAGLMAWAIYRRARRSIGRQKLAPGRMTFRIWFLGLVGTAITILFLSFHQFEIAGALLGGVAIGTALGYFGLRHTKFEATAEGRFYTPHTYIGLAITALFVGRVAYRIMVVLPAAHAAARVNENPFEAYEKSPLTMAIFGLVIGYYVFYYAGVLRHGRDLVPALPPDSQTGTIQEPLS